ncbi:MAG: hypothetical protein QNJ55_35465 [Xenococcus sp. MO_188.B8]|nr:hypothetical protein [Xenococcus sp. MO_188.B8]
MDPTIIVAIIGAVSAVIVAYISKSGNGEKDQAKATGGSTKSELKEKTKQSNTDRKLLISDTIRKYKVIVLGASGSGKTVFLASMFRELSILGSHGFFLKLKSERERKILNRIYIDVATRENWPSGTTYSEISEWDFLCCVQNETTLNIEPACQVTYVDYAGGRLTEHNDEDDDIEFLELLDQSDAFLGLIDGSKVLAWMNNENDWATVSLLRDDLPSILQIMQQRNVPVHFLLSKWDLLEDKYSLREIREKMMKIPKLRNFIKSRVRAGASISLIPVSSVGKEFVCPKPDGGMQKSLKLSPQPFQVEMPVACALVDELRFKVVSSVQKHKKRKNLFSKLRFRIISAFQKGKSLLRLSVNISSKKNDETMALQRVLTGMSIIQDKLRYNFPKSDLSDFSNEESNL